MSSSKLLDLILISRRWAKEQGAGGKDKARLAAPGQLCHT